MKIGFFKRAASYLLDAVPIIMLLMSLMSLFGENIVKDSIDNYDQLQAEYEDAEAAFSIIATGYDQQFEDEDITYEQYTELYNTAQIEFVTENSEIINVVFYEFWVKSAIAIIVIFLLIYTTYQIVLKGNTLGRRLMKIELKGKVTWYNIILRELFWKHLFWFFTFSAGLAIDLGLIAFTTKKKALRDTLSHTYLAPTGVNYPF